MTKSNIFGNVVNQAKADQAFKVGQQGKEKGND